MKLKLQRSTLCTIFFFLKLNFYMFNSSMGFFWRWSFPWLFLFIYSHNRPVKLFSFFVLQDLFSALTRFLQTDTQATRRDRWNVRNYPSPQGDRDESWTPENVCLWLLCLSNGHVEDDWASHDGDLCPFYRIYSMVPEGNVLYVSNCKNF